MSLEFTSTDRLAILNRTSSPQYLPAGCGVMPGPGTGFDSQASFQNVPPNCYLVLPPGQQITVPDGGSNQWFRSSPEWALAIYTATGILWGSGPLSELPEGYVWNGQVDSVGNKIVTFLPTITIALDT